MTKYEYNFIFLEFAADLQDTILAVAQGMEEPNTETWSAILETVQKTANEHGEEGWKLYAWYLQPVPHIVFERAVTSRKRSTRKEQ